MVQVWTAEEDALLRRAYADNEGKKGGWLKRLGLMMGRAPSNLVARAKRIGIKTSTKRTGGRPRKPQQMCLLAPISAYMANHESLRGLWSRHEHPRGMLGKKHSDETKRRFSMQRLGVKRPPFSEEHRKNMAAARIKLLHERPELTARSKRGHGGRRADLDNRYFRSSYEANYARYLNWSKVRWEYESKTFWFEGVKRGNVSYTPDFFLPDENVYHEVKGWMDDDSRVKLKRMAKHHPDVRVVVIGADWFKAAERQGLCSLIPHWECRHTEAARMRGELLKAG